MNDPHVRWLESGVYTIPGASRLTGISESRIRRWLQGYSYRKDGKRHDVPPVWEGSLPECAGRLAVSFRDLVEMRFLDAFLDLGVSWQKIRHAQAQAREQFGLTHPFCTNRFRSDGGHLVLEMMESTGRANVVDLESQQQLFAETTAPLREELEFDDGEGVVRWWPLGRSRRVVLDPLRSFGRPVTADEGIPTSVLQAAALQGYDHTEIAGWYETSVEAVLDACRFEEGLLT